MDWGSEVGGEVPGSQATGPWASELCGWGNMFWRREAGG